VIPVQFVLFTLSAIIGSAILYGDFQKAKFHQIVTFLYGCAATFVGVFTIAWTPVDVDPGILNTEDHGDSEESSMAPNASQAIHDGAPLDLNTIGRRRRGALVLPSGVTGPKDTPSPRHKRGGVVMGISPAQVRFSLQFWLPLKFVVRLSFSIYCSSTLLLERFLCEAGAGMPMSRGLRQNPREGAEQ